MNRSSIASRKIADMAAEQRSFVGTNGDTSDHDDAGALAAIAAAGLRALD